MQLVYQAYDGATFPSEEACRAYEEKLSAQTYHMYHITGAIQITIQNIHENIWSIDNEKARRDELLRFIGVHDFIDHMNMQNYFPTIDFQIKCNAGL